MSHPRKPQTWRRQPGWTATPSSVLSDGRLHRLGSSAIALYLLTWHMANLPGSNGCVSGDLLAFYGRCITRRQQVLDKLINAGYLVYDIQSASYNIPDWWNYNRPNHHVCAGQDAYSASYQDDGGSMDIESVCTHSVDKVCALCAHTRQDMTGQEKESAFGKDSFSLSDAGDASADATPQQAASRPASRPAEKGRNQDQKPRRRFPRPEVRMTSAEHIEMLRSLPKAKRAAIIYDTDDPGDLNPSVKRREPVSTAQSRWEAIQRGVAGLPEHRRAAALEALRALYAPTEEELAIEAAEMAKKGQTP